MSRLAWHNPEELTFQYHGSIDCASTLEENFDVEISDERPSHEINETSFQHELQELVDQGETDSIINEADLEITGTVSNESETSKEDQDPPVYPSCPLRLSDSVLLIMTLAIRHKLTGEALVDVIKLIDLHCIPVTQNRSIKSLRELKSYFVNSKEMLDLFYYCNCCFGLLTKECNVCPVCNRDLNSPSSKKYFVVLPMGRSIYNPTPPPPPLMDETDSYRLYCGRQIPTGCTTVDDFLLPVALWIQMCEVSVLMNETTGLFPIALFDSLSLRHLGT